MKGTLNPAGAIEAKRKPVNPARLRNHQVGRKKLRSQPFPRAGARMKRAPRTEEKGTAYGHFSPAAVLKGI